MKVLFCCRKNWKLSRDNSKFVDWQRVRCQESADEVPAGSLPRSMDVILRHETVRVAFVTFPPKLPAPVEQGRGVSAAGTVNYAR